MWHRRVCAIVSLVSALADTGCSSSAALPKKAVLLNTLGVQALAAGDLPGAEARLSVALEYSPRFVEAWVNLGYVELGRGSFEQARRNFLRARELNQDIPAPHHALGVLAEAEGKTLQAESFYRAALKVDPGFAPARANLARRLFARGQFENAREQFERLVAVAPGEVRGWAGWVESLLELGREADAQAALAHARDRLGDLPALMLLAGREKLYAADWEDAEATLAPLTGQRDRASAAAAWAWIAVARVGRGDPSGAEQASRAALAIDRDDPVALYALRAARTPRPAGGPIIGGRGTQYPPEPE
jgi:tetratricopeptide (TPR) repeat protein